MRTLFLRGSWNPETQDAGFRAAFGESSRTLKTRQEQSGVTDGDGGG
jgi:hypothetical protein